MNETKICRICGQEKPIEDFSKSYKHLCKECVAEDARKKRREGIAKAQAEGASHAMYGHRLTIATAVLQGLLAGGRDGSNSIDFIARRAVTYADALINELNKTKDEVATDK